MNLWFNFAPGSALFRFAKLSQLIFEGFFIHGDVRPGAGPGGQVGSVGDTEGIQAFFSRGGQFSAVQDGVREVVQKYRVPVRGGGGEFLVFGPGDRKAVAAVKADVPLVLVQAPPFEPAVLDHDLAQGAGDLKTVGPGSLAC